MMTDTSSALANRWPVVGLAVLFIAALALSPGAAGQTPAGPPRLELEAPAEVEVGAPITVVLRAHGSPGLAGYEATVRYDTAAAHFSGLDQRGGDLAPGGRGGEALGPVELADGVAFGLVTCAAEHCAAPGPESAPRQKAGPAARLATVAVVADRPGVLELRLDDLVAVDAAGTRLALAPPPPLHVRVGDGGAPIAAPSPTSPPGPLSAAETGSRAQRGGGEVAAPDLMELILDWRLAREAGTPCAVGLATDLNGDGCVDVADVQAAAGRIGPEEESSLQQAGQTFTVNSTGDGGDAQPGDGRCADSGGGCTLRAAITEANSSPGADTVAFNIPGEGPHTIQLGGRLPSLTDTSGPTTIDGYTQPGAQPNSDLLASNAGIRIEVRGNGAGRSDGIVITSPGNVIRGLALFNHARAILLMGSGASGNQILGNYIGTDARGQFLAPSRRDSAIGGVALYSGASRNVIGGDRPADRNVISGNPADGISLKDEATDRNIIAGNLIGLAPDGQTRLLNRIHGVDIDQHASNTMVGGEQPGSRNVIGGNVRSGVEISHGTGTLSNRVIGNYIGTDVYGRISDATGNRYGGVRLEDGVQYNVVRGNLIGGNVGGVQVLSPLTEHNQIVENYIGVDRAGQPIPNREYGIVITYHAQRTTIGPGNVIAYNPHGIRISGDVDNDYHTITRNSIYANEGLGIDLAPYGVANPNDREDRDDGPNDMLNYPVLEQASPTEVAGRACAGCTVEIFLANGGQDRYGQGRTLAAVTTAGADGRFQAALTDVSAGQYLTATATDGMGNTSEFSLNRLVSSAPAENPIPTPSPTPSPTPTTGPGEAVPPAIYLPAVHDS